MTEIPEIAAVHSTVMTDDEAMIRLSANEIACYRWPMDTAEHRAMRAAFMDGAASVTPSAATTDDTAAKIMRIVRARLEFYERNDSDLTAEGRHGALVLTNLERDLVALLERGAPATSPPQGEVGCGTPGCSDPKCTYGQDEAVPHVEPSPSTAMTPAVRQPDAVREALIKLLRHTWCLGNISGMKEFTASKGGKTWVDEKPDLEERLDAALAEAPVGDAVGKPTPVEMKWPSGCHSANSCDRHQECMYVGCRYESKDIRADIEAAKAALLPRQERQHEAG